VTLRDPNLPVTSVCFRSARHSLADRLKRWTSEDLVIADGQNDEAPTELLQTKRFRTGGASANGQSRRPHGLHDEQDIMNL